ncbi:peptidase A4 family-domain-containing protein [Lentinula raphanica]|uniref:Peptidase A4 family-domain-containing protein n=1 Tax=Lentinula raphanica TaxID=153919 RepID=A0AA38P4M0_9AGAR|nr:peptidase A4 family-domain-containing protein [Lentinula raphanica]KAJ3836223.1 peptidase A4 family-domain-containing protein [Lentinula raphanica]KAJ3970859.1 peptidase A4 family-domain-containing protein [Lentinula raphanica]
MMLKVLAATLVLTSILFSTDARPTPPPLPPIDQLAHRDKTPEDIHSGVTVFSPEGERIVKATGRFRLPDIHPNLRTIGDQVAFWVGISGEPRPHLVQAGVVMYVAEEGVKFHAFIEWFPDLAKWTPEMDLEVGHEIEIMVRIEKGGRKATMYIKDHTTGKYLLLENFEHSDSNHEPFKGFRASWMVEPAIMTLPDSRYMHPLANFGQITFYDCSTKTDKSTKLDLSESNRRRVLTMDKSEVAPTEVVIGSGQGISEFQVLVT